MINFAVEKKRMKLTQANLFVFIVTLLIVGQIFQIFTLITRIPTFYPAIALLLLFTVLINPSVFKSSSLLLTLLLFAALSTINMANHLKNLPDVLLEPFGIFTMVFPYLVTAIILENLCIFNRRDNSIPYKIGRFFLMIFILSLFITLINEILFPGITRGGNTQNLPVWAWTLSFGSIYGTPFVLMTIIAFYKGNNIKLFFFILVIFFMLISAGFLTALILSVITSLSGLFFRLNIRKTYFALSAILLFTIFALYNLNVFVAFLPDLPNQVYQQKAKDLTELQKNESAAELIFSTRQGVYDHSLKAIFRAPFFGTGNYDDIGQHSYWLDKIGFIGLFGIMFYLLVLYSLYKRSILLLNKIEVEFYKILIIIVMGYLFFNPVEWPDFWLIIFILIPSLIIFLREDKLKTQS